MTFMVHAVMTALVASGAYAHDMKSEPVKRHHLLRAEEPVYTPPPRCFGQECVELMDDIHWNVDDHRTVRNFAHKYNGLKTIRCVPGVSSCELFYELPEISQTYDIPFISSLSSLMNSFMASLIVPTASNKAAGVQEFYSIAKSTTDKVTVHHYETTYQEYLGNYSKPDAKPFVMVEVGFAKGQGARVWHQFLPKAKLHEFEGHCDEAWNVADTSPGGIKGQHRDLGFCTLHCGDGTKAAFLEDALKNEEPPFIVVDDGGHSPEEMKSTFEIMWPKLQPGGFFFVEDLAESYAPGIRSDAFVEHTIKPLVQDFVRPSSAKPLLGRISDQVESIQCREGICALRKKRP